MPLNPSQAVDVSAPDGAPHQVAGVEVVPGTGGWAKVYRARTTPMWMVWEVVMVALMWAAIGVFVQ